MHTNGLPPVHLTPPGPRERDAIFLDAGYTDRLRLLGNYMALMDARDHAIQFIHKCGLLEAYARHCQSTGALPPPAG